MILPTFLPSYLPTFLSIHSLLFLLKVAHIPAGDAAVSQGICAAQAGGWAGPRRRAEVIVFILLFRYNNLKLFLYIEERSLAVLENSKATKPIVTLSLITHLPHLHMSLLCHSCWGWYITMTGGPELHFGGHDYFPVLESPTESVSAQVFIAGNTRVDPAACKRTSLARET